MILSLLNQFKVINLKNITFSKTALFISISLIYLTLLLTFAVNWQSTLGYFYYFIIWLIFIVLFDHVETKTFTFAFVVNGFLTVVYITIQCLSDPTSYGTTSPTGSWTDDSYFFALLADKVPTGLFTRENYFTYSEPFSNLIRFLTPFKIYHPLDVIYFQSGIAALLCTYVKKFTIQITEDKTIGYTAYLFCLVSPFLLMHGGAILIRDSAVAALFIFSLSCINSKRYFPAFIAISLQFFLRIGTGFILLPLYFIIFFNEIKIFFNQFKNYAYIIPLFLLTILLIYIYQSIIIENLNLILLSKGVSASGREIFDDLESGNGNVIFLFIQNQSFVIKLILSSLYVFLYPFLNSTGSITDHGVDMRTILVNVVYPIYLFWLNAWFFSTFLDKNIKFDKKKLLIIAFIVGFFMIGIFSLQTRHKTIMLPLYYIFVAIGFSLSSKNSKLIGYTISGSWVLIQISLRLVAFIK